MAELIVSLTTMRSRLGIVGRAIRSIRRGSLRPDRIVLNISSEPYFLDEGVSEADLPSDLRSMRDRGRLTIADVPNTGPFRKLLPLVTTLTDEAIVVTADDDIRYPHRWLEELVAAHELTGRSTAFRARPVRIEEGQLSPYHFWRVIREGHAPHFGQIREESRRLLMVPTGCHGILYRSSWFSDVELVAALRALAPKQDDLAFRALMIAQGIEVELLHYVPREGERGFKNAGRTPHSLYETNITDNSAVFANLISLLRDRGLFCLSDHLNHARA